MAMGRNSCSLLKIFLIYVFILFIVAQEKKQKDHMPDKNLFSLQNGRDFLFMYKFLHNLLDQGILKSISFRRWPGGRVVMQRTANPFIPVRFRSRPPNLKKD